MRRRLRLRRRSPWILFCISLCALVLSVLVGPHLNCAGRHHGGADDYAALRLARHASGSTALARAERELSEAPAGHPWVGEYWGGELLFNHPCTRLVLGFAHYAVLERSDANWAAEPSLGAGDGQFLLEWGEVRANGECIELAAEGLATQVLPRALVWIDRGSVAHLMVVESIPSIYYPPGFWPEEPHAAPIRMLTRDLEHAGAAARPTSVPEAYRGARENEPHLRVLEYLPSASPQRAPRWVLSVPEGVLVKPEQPIWWDAEACTRVHGFIESVEIGRAIAVLDLPDGLDPARITTGSTFSRLPRLE